MKFNEFINEAKVDISPDEELARSFKKIIEIFNKIAKQNKLKVTNYTTRYDGIPCVSFKDLKSGKTYKNIPISDFTN